MSSKFGSKLEIEVWGASHAPEIGITIKGIPENTEIDLERVQAFLNRRKGGQNAYSTKRAEADTPVIKSGIREGLDAVLSSEKKEDENDENVKRFKTVSTNGEDLTAVFLNQNTRSSDYDEMRYIPRPSHADFTSYMKYGDKLDRSGGGMFSGRLTLPVCFAGAVCMQMLEKEGIRIFGHVSSIGGIEDKRFDSCNPKEEEVGINESRFPVLDNAAGERMVSYMTQCANEGDSVGGCVECAVTGLPVGVGEPLYDSLEAVISHMIFGIPAVKGIEFGSGFKCSEMKGSECNDPFCISDGKVKTKTNHSGGIQGGISNGMPLIIRVAFKPTPSIYKEQQTVNMKDLTETTLSLKGRHDPCIVPRALPCVEAALAIAVYNLFAESKTLRMPVIIRQEENKTALTEGENALSASRIKIDALDEEIAGLFAKRMELAAAIAEEKSRQGLPVKNEVREEEVLSHVGSVAGADKEEYVRNVYRKLMDETGRFEETLMKKDS